MIREILRPQKQFGPVNMIKFIALLALVAATYATPDDYIVGGSDAPRNRYPWQVSMERCGIFGCSHSCGAVLISNTWILTAAHCVQGSAPSSFQWVVGQFVRGSTPDGSNKRLTASAITVHAGFIRDGRRGFPNDVAVVRLQSAAPVDGTSVKVAKLPASHPKDFTSSECWISGWGRTRGGGSLATNLQHAQTNVITKEECQSRWGNSIQDMHICLYDKASGSRGACQGDSGGPLQCLVGGAFEVAGVTSWGQAQCNTGYPSVYARTSYFRAWIKQQSGV